MLVALAIIGVAAVIAAPSFSAWLESLTVRKATRQMVTDLQFARMRAISDGVQYRVRFDSPGVSYALEKGNRSSGSETWTQVEVARNLRDKRNPYYAKNVALNHNYPNDCVVFSPAGVSGMGTVKVSAGSCANGTVTCQPSPKRRCERCVRTILTGRVAIAE
jgi:Tfp pilus assembly protein FimT